jgi:adenylate cyclase class IV
MRNVEAKVRCADLAGVRARALTLGAHPAGRLEQVDTYFQASQGRLKLRELREVGRPPAAWLIGYGRPDAAGARVSQFEMAPVHDPAALLAVLSGTLGVRGRVEKAREVLWLRHTRIHLDEVRALGTFVELETLIGPEDARRGGVGGVDDVAAGERELAELLAALGLRLADGVAGSYVDLLSGDAEREGGGA